RAPQCCAPRSGTGRRRSARLRWTWVVSLRVPLGMLANRRERERQAGTQGRGRNPPEIVADAMDRGNTKAARRPVRRRELRLAGEACHLTHERHEVENRRPLTAPDVVDAAVPLRAERTERGLD